MDITIEVAGIREAEGGCITISTTKDGCPFDIYTAEYSHIYTSSSFCC